MNRLKIKYSDIRNIFLFLVVVISILFSKTMYFGVENRQSFQYVFYLSAIIAAIVGGLNKKTLTNNLIRFAPMIFLILIHIILDRGMAVSGSNNIIFATVLTFLCCLIISSSITRQQFWKLYIKSMTIMSVISIPFFILSVFFQNIAARFVSTSMSWNNSYEYSIFYTFGRRGIIHTRNSGMFWEPGAFQAFLLLAILFILFLKMNNEIEKNEVKKYKRCFVILIITLLTTRSTTGYILLFLIILVFYRQIVSLLVTKKSHESILKLFIGVLFILIVLLIVFSDTISGKFSSDNASAMIRQNDLLMSLQLVFSRQVFLFGIGNTTTLSSLSNSLNLTSNSVGILTLGYTYGVIMLLLYLRIVVIGLTENTKEVSLLYRLMTIMAFLTMGFTESLWSLPVFILVLCSFKQR